MPRDKQNVWMWVIAIIVVVALGWVVVANWNGGSDDGNGTATTTDETATTTDETSTSTPTSTPPVGAAADKAWEDFKRFGNCTPSKTTASSTSVRDFSEKGATKTVKAGTDVQKCEGNNLFIR